MSIAVRGLLALLLLPATLSAQQGAAARAPYVPSPTEWQRRTAQQVGLEQRAVDSAVAIARQRESRSPRDLEEAHYQTFGREPFGVAVGPFKPRGEQTGIVVRNGYIVAEWGEPDRVDMTFSVTKSFVSTVVGLAMDRGLVRDLDAPVHLSQGPVLHAATPELMTEGGRGRFNARAPIDLFGTEHNRRITWRQLLQQTSDWEGTLWGKPEWADRPAQQPATWWTRDRVAPGTVHEYNDTRVNVLALAALNIWRRPLPDVLRDLVMDPIGASPTWRWYGYDNSWVVLDGAMVQSVSGGGHWGGGMFISARDMARFGLLTCRDGRWGDRQLLSRGWLEQARTASDANPQYGFMNFYLNTGRRQLPSASERTYLHLGNGTNAIICDPDRDLVVVLRWVDQGALDQVMQQLLAGAR
jgi:CubicO group peptidase (beta-lactamase class C family)